MEEDLGDISTITLRQAADKVLELKKPEDVDTLLAKLQEIENLTRARELLVISHKTLEGRLNGNNSFNLLEVGWIMEIRQWCVDQSKPKRGGDRNDRQNRGRQGPRQRSRSPRHSSIGKGSNKGKGKSKHKGRYDRSDRYEDRDWRNARDRRPSPEKPAFWAAVEKGDEDAVARLIESKADIEEKHKGWSPLMKAAEENEVAILKLLLDNKANTDVSNHKGRTALSFAAGPSMGRDTATGTLRLLLESGADFTKKDAFGITPKARALREERKDALEIFEEFDR